MKTREFLNHFLVRSPWVDPDHTVDKIINEDADTGFNACFVTWMPTFDILRKMVQASVPLLMCHEPVFWNHLNDAATSDPLNQEKHRYIIEHNLVIVRNHDCWDRWPNIGIPWAWANFLGFGTNPAVIGADGFQHRYDIDHTPLDTLAKHIASRCAVLGEPSVQVTGDPSKFVSRIGTGTGCGCEIGAFQAMGCDCSIVCDDGSLYWAGIQKAEDGAHPVIRVNHGTSEEPGMVTLTRYINEQIPGMRARHIPHGCTYRLVSAD